MRVCQTLATEAKRKKIDVYDVLTEEAAVTPPGAEGLLFLPYLAGERTPHADPNARGAFVGLTLKHARGHMVRSIMEGVTYSLRDCLEIIEELGVAVKQIRASGGGAKSPFWRQMQADVLGKTVVTMAADEGPALRRGAARRRSGRASSKMCPRRATRRENEGANEASRRGAENL